MFYFPELIKKPWPMKGYFEKGKRYQVFEKIAQGTYAEVYRGHDLKHDLPVALKIYPMTEKGYATVWNAKGELISRLEAEIQAPLDHPNITKVYKFFVANDPRAKTKQKISVVAQEYLSSDKYLRLDHLIKSQVQLYLSDITQIISDLASAIDYLHENNLYHRDIKPGNVFYARGRWGRNTKLIDFGISSKIHSGSPGSPIYTHPQWLLGSISKDNQLLNGYYYGEIYSLALLFYELLARKHPFHQKQKIKNDSASVAMNSLNCPYQNWGLIYRPEEVTKFLKPIDHRAIQGNLYKLDQILFAALRINNDQNHSYFKKANDFSKALNNLF